MTGCSAGEMLLVKLKRTDVDSATFYLHKPVKFVIPEPRRKGFPLVESVRTLV
jgi:hypothetical protein